MARGRKRKHYFGPEQEDAVVRYLESPNDEERNDIYNKWLRDVFIKMIESLIRKKDLVPDGYTHEEILVDTLSHLITKMNKFDINANKKAYSYFTVICKNHILGFKIKEDKERNRKIPFDTVLSTFEEDERHSYSLSDTDYTKNDLINDICEEIKEELEAEGVTKKKMKLNERKLGFALIEILGNWEDIFTNLEGGSKYNKNSILGTIRDYTNMTTKDIRVSMKRFKKLYNLLKLSKINDGYI